MIYEYFFVGALIAIVLIGFILLDLNMQEEPDTFEAIMDICITVILSIIWPITLCGYTLWWLYHLAFNKLR